MRKLTSAVAAPATCGPLHRMQHATTCARAARFPLPSTPPARNAAKSAPHPPRLRPVHAQWRAQCRTCRQSPPPLSRSNPADEMPFCPSYALAVALTTQTLRSPSNVEVSDLEFQVSAKP